MGMTFEEKGAYLELLLMQFNRGHMTSHMVGQVVGQLWGRIQDKFVQDENGLWYNVKMEACINERRKFTESRRNNLKGVNQYTKNKDKKSGHMGGHKTSHMEDENINEDKDVFKGGTGENWNQNPKPDDVPELPELKLRSTVEFLYYTRKLNVPDQTILGLFSVFRNQHLTGKKFYQTRDDVYTHFLNWIRNQPIADATANTKNNGKSAGLKSFMEELQRESGFNPIRSGDPGG